MEASNIHGVNDNQVEPDIYLCTTGYCDGRFNAPVHHEWYKIRGDSTTRPEDEDKILSRQLYQLPHLVHKPAWAVLGSNIYLIGGKDTENHQSTREVYYIDMCNPSDGWKRASPMKAERSEHYAFVYENQIYVFGLGIHHKSSQPWAESYDPTTDTWHALPLIRKVLRFPMWITGHAILSDGGVNGNGKKILLYSSSETTIYYDLELELWGNFSTNFFQKYTRARDYSPVSIDGILYFLLYDYHESSYNVYAYDISKPESEFKPVRGIEREHLPVEELGHNGREAPTLFTVSLGNGKLGLLWGKKSYHHEDGHMLQIIFSKYQMLKKKNKRGEIDFEAKLISPSKHYVRGQSVQTCLTVMKSDTQEGASSNTRSWTLDEDWKLIEALRISQNVGKYNSVHGLDTEIYDFIEKILSATLPESEIKADPHIKSRITILKSKFDIIDEMIQGSSMSGFQYDDTRKCVVADQSVWKAYLKSHERAAPFKESRFPFYRELCDIFRKN